MLIGRPDDIPSSEITDESLYWTRREWLATAGLGMTAFLPFGPSALRSFRQELVPNKWEEVTGYNNFYEFGTGKEDPAANAKAFKTKPWTITVEGEVAKPATFDVDSLFKGLTAEERVYRFRCVEAWSMVVPWNGYPLRDVIKRLNPTSKAKYVEFTTLLDPKQMPGQRYDVLEWPYVEALRLDEAMHPLALLVTGVYGKTLPNQNGAPVRLITPWKYGFKGGKSIARIRFVEKQPRTSWMLNWPEAYGFYSNVNPAVPHPRHSQATEARLPSFFRSTRTLMFNGYDEVASLYSGLDLKKNY